MKYILLCNCRLLLSSTPPSWREVPRSILIIIIQFSPTGKYVKCASEIEFWPPFCAASLDKLRSQVPFPRPFSWKKVLLLLFFRYFDDNCEFSDNFRQYFLSAFFDAMIQRDWKTQLSQLWHKTPTACRIRE